MGKPTLYCCHATSTGILQPTGCGINDVIVVLNEYRVVNVLHTSLNRNDFFVISQLWLGLV